MPSLLFHTPLLQSMLPFSLPLIIFPTSFYYIFSSLHFSSSHPPFLPCFSIPHSSKHCFHSPSLSLSYLFLVYISLASFLIFTSSFPFPIFHTPLFQSMLHSPSLSLSSLLIFTIYFPRFTSHLCILLPLPAFSYPTPSISSETFRPPNWLAMRWYTSGATQHFPVAAFINPNEKLSATYLYSPG